MLSYIRTSVRIYFLLKYRFSRCHGKPHSVSVLNYGPVRFQILPERLSNPIYSQRRWPILALVTWIGTFLSEVNDPFFLSISRVPEAFSFLTGFDTGSGSQLRIRVRFLFWKRAGNCPPSITFVYVKCFSLKVCKRYF